MKKSVKTTVFQQSFNEMSAQHAASAVVLGRCRNDTAQMDVMDALHGRYGLLLSAPTVKTLTEDLSKLIVDLMVVCHCHNMPLSHGIEKVIATDVKKAKKENERVESSLIQQKRRNTTAFKVKK